MEDEPERGSGASSSSSTAVPIRGGSSEAGTSSSSSSNASQVHGAEEIHGGRFPSRDWFRDRVVEEEQRQIEHSHGGVDLRVSEDAARSPVVGDETWSCVIVLVTFWFFVSMTLILGVYGSVTLQLGPNSSLLLQPSPLFVQSIKVEEQSESTTGPILYGLYQTPALDVVKIWSETHNVSVSTDSYKDLMYYLNEGSQINISYTVNSPSSSIFLIIAQGSEGLAQWLENPAYPNSTLSWNIIHGSGVIWQDILTSSSYYVAVGNLNSDDTEVQLNLSIKSSLYNISKAYYKCNLSQGSCSMSILFPEGNAAVLSSLGTEQAVSGQGLYVKLSYGPRLVTYILGIGGMTVLMLYAFNFFNKFQSNRDGTGSSHEQIRSEREPLLSRKDDDLSSWGSSYDSLSHDEEDLDEFLAVGSQEGKSFGDGENSNNTRRLCAICFDAPRDCFFLPCGHCVACFACGTRIAEADGTCPICRRKMKKVRKIFTV